MNAQEEQQPAPNQPIDDEDDIIIIEEFDLLELSNENNNLKKELEELKNTKTTENEFIKMKNDLEELQNTKTTEYENIEFARMTKGKFDEMDAERRRKNREIEQLKQNSFTSERETELLNNIKDLEEEVESEENKVAEFKSKWRIEQNRRMRWKKHYDKLEERCYFPNTDDTEEISELKHLNAEEWNSYRGKMLERFNEISLVNKIMKKERKEKVLLDNYLYLQKEYTIEDIGTNNFFYTRNTLKDLVLKYSAHTPVRRDNKKMLAEIIQRNLLIPNIIKIQRRFRYKKTLPIRFIFDITTLRMRLEQLFSESTETERYCLKSIMIENEVVEPNGNIRNTNLDPYTDADDGKRFSMIWTIVLSKENNRYFAGSILTTYEQRLLAQEKYTAKDFNNLKNRFKDINFLDTHTEMGFNRYAFSDAVVKSFVVAES